MYNIIGKGNEIRFHDGCKNLKPPYLLLSNHASMIDFAIAAKATFPHRCNWVITIEEFIGKEWLMRGIGGIYKRKFTSDITVVKHILDVIKRQKGICVMYPEARYSLAGINERMSGGIGKLVKIAKCPVVVLIEHGNYIREPQWNKAINGDNPVTADMRIIVSEEDAQKLTADQIQKRIEDAFVYDDYSWQFENKIRLTKPNRADHLERILYKCPVCGEEFSMIGSGTKLGCKKCGANWTMDIYGRLHRNDGEDIFAHIPDWYNWERECVNREVDLGEYVFKDIVRLEHLVNCKKGFEYLGNVKMVQDSHGIRLSGRLKNGECVVMQRSPESMMSVHIEYDFLKRGVSQRGPAIDLVFDNETYFVFPTSYGDHLTKIHFATEALYNQAVKKSQIRKLRIDDDANEMSIM